jgi:hypothetical protein
MTTTKRNGRADTRVDQPPIDDADDKLGGRPGRDASKERRDHRRYGCRFSPPVGWLMGIVVLCSCLWYYFYDDDGGGGNNMEPFDAAKMITLDIDPTEECFPFQQYASRGVARLNLTAFMSKYPRYKKLFRYMKNQSYYSYYDNSKNELPNRNPTYYNIFHGGSQGTLIWIVSSYTERLYY